MDRYTGLDAHASSCTGATVGPSGRRLHSQVAETNAGALIRVLRAIPGTRHLCLEEGTHASWLYEVLSPLGHQGLCRPARYGATRSKKSLSKRSTERPACFSKE